MKKLLIAALLLLITVSVNAIPAKPVKKTLRTADGTLIEVTLCGDEHFSFYTDNNGNPFVMKGGRLERVTNDEVTATWTALKAERLQLAAQSQVANGVHKAPRKLGSSGTTVGTQRGLVILMQFTDVPFETPDPKAYFTKFFNEVGFSDAGCAGSVRDYFLAQSYNKLTINFDVVGPFTTRREMSYYGAPIPEEKKNDARPAHMAAEAVDAASAEVNFSNYDWDGDGVVDQVFIVYAGYNQAQGADANTIWPHEWSISAGTGSAKKYNGVTINTYGCSSELRGDGAAWKGGIDGIGTACHEFSHCLGLPDMYDTSNNDGSPGGWGTGYWDIMCAGSYNDNGCTPAGYTSYERWFASWLEPVELTSMTRITDMKPVATHPEAYILYNEKNRNEYYMLENRQPVGFDKKLYGHGLLILHVDYNEGAWNSNSVNSTDSHQRMTIIPADNKLSDYNMSGDPWPGTSGNTALTNYSTPAATLFNVNTDGRPLMSKPIDNITENTGAMTVSFVACRPELPIPSPDGGQEQASGNAFKVTWPAVSGAVGYQLELTEIGGTSADPSQELDREFTFDAFVKSSTGYTDIANANGTNKLPDYGLSGWTGSKIFCSPNKMLIGTSSVTGWIQTPWWSVPKSYDLTVVIGAKPFTNGTPVDAVLTLGYANNTGATETKKETFTVSADQRQVFNFPSIHKEYYSLTIEPAARMYLNYLAVYNGIWSAEQLGINGIASAPSLAINEPVYFETTANSYVFTNLNTSNRFIYRIRAKGEENTWSDWSEEKVFAFASSGIAPVLSTDSDAPVRYFDLNGREVDASARGVIIVKQGNSVRKVVRR